MASKSEVGHAKNVANFNMIVQSVIALGADYNPARDSIKLTALTAMKEVAKADLEKVIGHNVALNNVLNTRSIAFSGLKPLSTRIMGALKSSEVSTELIDDAKGYNRKIQGRRASPKPVADPGAEPPKYHSASQQSFDSQIQHFSGLIALLDSLESYEPGKADLKVPSLNEKMADLITTNDAVPAAFIEAGKARAGRNKTLYETGAGLVDTARSVKEYVKSLFGAKSPEYVQIRRIRLRKLKL